MHTVVHAEESADLVGAGDLAKRGEQGGKQELDEGGGVARLVAGTENLEVVGLSRRIPMMLRATPLANQHTPTGPAPACRADLCSRPVGSST